MNREGKLFEVIAHSQDTAGKRYRKTYNILVTEYSSTGEDLIARQRALEQFTNDSSLLILHFDVRFMCDVDFITGKS